MAQKKSLTADQVQAKKDKAVQFLRDVVGDDDKADQFEVLDQSGKHYKANGVFAIVDPQGVEYKFFASYSSDLPLAPVTAQDGKIAQLTFVFGVPHGVELKQLVMGTTVIAELSDAKIP